MNDFYVIVIVIIIFFYLIYLAIEAFCVWIVSLFASFKIWFLAVGWPILKGVLLIGLGLLAIFLIIRFGLCLYNRYQEAQKSKAFARSSEGRLTSLKSELLDKIRTAKEQRYDIKKNIETEKKKIAEARGDIKTKSQNKKGKNSAKKFLDLLQHTIKDYEKAADRLTKYIVEREQDCNAIDFELKYLKQDEKEELRLQQLEKTDDFLFNGSLGDDFGDYFTDRFPEWSFFHNPSDESKES